MLKLFRCQHLTLLARAFAEANQHTNISKSDRSGAHAASQRYSEHPGCYVTGVKLILPMSAGMVSDTIGLGDNNTNRPISEAHWVRPTMSVQVGRYSQYLPALLEPSAPPSRTTFAPSSI